MVQNCAATERQPEPSRSLIAFRVEPERVGRRQEDVAVEVPVAFFYNNRAFAVMLASPSDLEDYVRGFSLTEDVVGGFEDVQSIEIRPVARGVEIHAEIPFAWAARLAQRQRALAGRSGCGLCGADSFSDVFRPVAKIEGEPKFSAAAVRAAVAALSDHQALNRVVGAVHAAAFADEDGNILFCREDVGRHNALDKLIGALGGAGVSPASGFVVISSRCSYEMVHKAAMAGIGLIAAVSAPTSLAVELATKTGVGLLAFARETRFTIYAGERRVVC
ncbi:FdhD protein [Rhodoblastus acidophilus]|uniref:formate dehydrogenase accessory sulfurtransferase FdhD n=1 Tax=Rhodoblastus acidophilus TaxID=1074 RepID=UPI0022250E0B|nr:formate dehydrogenase accessory sulfurtransferase FdhD [Rhodoblastus acidophilus]MCW2285425.1 FdhD protein [Rhodoblastus acidophilus]MCW2334326.1 FdhD protein [Rhodoblastus acidophilus]